MSATAAVGHSFGELTALHAAGYYDEDAFHYLSFKRGELMAKKVRVIVAVCWLPWRRQTRSSYF